MLSTVSVDLIYDEDGNVQILEFGRALKAGFKGYKAAHKGARKSNLWYQQVMPFLRSHDAPVWKTRKGKKRLAKVELFDKHAQEHIDSKARINGLELNECEGLVISPDPLTDVEFLAHRRAYPRVGLIDGFFPLNAAFNNKAILASAFGDDLIDVMPHQRTYEKTYWENLVEQVSLDFEGAERIVIK